MRDVSVKLVIILLSAFIVSCRDNASFSILPDGQEFDINNAGMFTNKLDILFVIDNSSSMQNNQNKLAASFNKFITGFVQKGWDYKIAVTTSEAYRIQFQNIHPGWTDEVYAKFKDGSGQDLANHSGVFVITPSTTDPIGAFNKNVKVGTGGTGDERAFSSFWAALRSPTNAGFLRNDSFLAIIILSDEDDFSDLFEGTTQTLSADPRRVSTNDHDYTDVRLDPVDSYVTYLDGLTSSSGNGRRYAVSAIIKPDLTSCTDGSANIYGKRYIELAQKTGGVISNICNPDFNQAVSEIQTRISELSTQVHLDRTPIESTIVVTINGVALAHNQTNGWWYFSDGNVIRFYGSAVPSANVKVRVDFTPTGGKI